MTKSRTAALILTASAAFFWGLSAASASETQTSTVPRGDKHARVTAGEPDARRAAGQSSGWVDLSQDSASGAGFYPLPPQYRNGALQTRQRRALEYANNPIRSAIASEEIGYDFDEGYAFGHGHGVFDPDDGYGTPFFAGYYNNR
ncbi:hypothetical protein [Methylocapsa palsarum]|nr:hypothetical protein [Methylocapsa palsarum]